MYYSWIVVYRLRYATGLIDESDDQMTTCLQVIAVLIIVPVCICALERILFCCALRLTRIAV